MMKTAWVVLAATAVSLPAQVQGDPREKVQEILDEVAGELKQIDSWLRESSRTGDAARSMKKNAARLDDLLDNAGKSQKEVIRGIEELLKAAEKLKGDGD